MSVCIYCVCVFVHACVCVCVIHTYICMGIYTHTYDGDFTDTIECRSEDNVTEC